MFFVVIVTLRIVILARNGFEFNGGKKNKNKIERMVMGACEKGMCVRNTNFGLDFAGNAKESIRGGICDWFWNRECLARPRHGSMGWRLFPRHGKSRTHRCRSGQPFPGGFETADRYATSTTATMKQRDSECPAGTNTGYPNKTGCHFVDWIHLYFTHESKGLEISVGIIKKNVKNSEIKKTSNIAIIIHFS